MEAQEALLRQRSALDLQAKSEERRGESHLCFLSFVFGVFFVLGFA